MTFQWSHMCRAYSAASLVSVAVGDAAAVYDRIEKRVESQESRNQKREESETDHFQSE